MQSIVAARGRSTTSARIRTRLSACVLTVGCLAGGVAGVSVLGASTAAAAPTPTPSASASNPSSANPGSGNPGSSAAARAAGTWLASRLVKGQYLVNPYAKTPGTPDVPGTADAIIGLAASGAASPTAATADVWLQKQAHGLTTPGQVAKVLLAAEAMGDDVHHYGGVDLPAVLQAQLAAPKADLTNPYGDALAIIALHRAGVTAPAPLVSALLKQQQPDGEFFFTGKPNTPDPDSTGAAISALADVSANPAATAAAQKAVAWAGTHRSAQGYWGQYSPVNTTGIVGSALNDTGADVTSSLAWMEGQQKLAGGQGLPATLDGSAPDAYATAQGLLLLGGVSLETVKYTVTTSPVSVPPSPSASSTPTPTPAPSSVGTSHPAPNPLPATGDSDGAASDNGLLVGAGVMGAAALVALFMGRRRR